MSRSTIVNIVFLVVLLVLGSLNYLYAIHWIFYAVVVFIFVVINVVGSCFLSLQYYIPAQCSGAASSGAIAITFDDGPLPVHTQHVLDVLSRYQVKATFFCIGHRVKKNPALIRKIHDARHLVGNHSYWHGKTFDLQSVAAIEKEIVETNEVITKVIGHTPQFFRPPYGVTNPMVAGAVKRGKSMVVGWSVRSFDTIIKDQDKLWNRVTRSLKSGDIVLFHDYSESMIKILPRFIEHAQKLGLKIVRVDELLNVKGYVEK